MFLVTFEITVLAGLIIVLCLVSYAGAKVHDPMSNCEDFSALLSVQNGSAAKNSKQSAEIQSSNWTVELTVSDQQSSFTRVFGGNDGATEGYDSGLDIISPPPGFAYYAYFFIAQFPYYLHTDIKNWSEQNEVEAQWNLKIINAAGKTTTVSWDPSVLPPYGNFLLETDSSVNMRILDVFTTTGNAEIKIKYVPSTAIKPVPESNCYHYIFYQNYPNPFNAVTNFRYVISSPDHTTIEIYNCQGQRVRSLLNTYQAAGSHEVNWDGLMDSGGIAPSGEYFVRFISGQFNSVKSLVFLK